MLNIHRTYFGTEGHTATSCNHLCNVAKEKYQLLEEELKNLSFVSETIQIIGESEVETESASCTNPSRITEILNEIATLKGFIANMRVAIKEKESLEIQLQSYKSDALLAFVPYDSYKHEPTMPRGVTNDDLQKYLLPNEFAKYLILEAKASTIGKAIHPNGEFANAREKAFQYANKPSKVNVNGRDTIIYKYKLACSPETIDETFFDLQKKHREIEAEMNGLKSKVETILKDNYTVALDEHNRKIRESQQEFTKLIEESIKERDNLISELRSLKIVIPPQYKDLVVELSK